MKRGFIHMGALSMSLQQLDLMIAIANKADVRLFDIEAMARKAGRWYMQIKDWGWVSTSELLKGAKHQ